MLGEDRVWHQESLFNKLHLNEENVKLWYIQDNE